jgi:membrane-associated protease RseP (regulator of RpoE activity)
MRRSILLVTKLAMALGSAMAVGCAIALTPQLACGQTFLNRLEDQLGSAAPAADAESTVGNGYLGLEPDETDQSGRGVKIIRVTPGAPADQGGLKAQDTITAINGTPIRELGDLDKVLDASSVGTRLSMTIVRAGQTQSKTVTLGRRPGSNPAADNPGEAPPMPETTPPSSLPTGGGLSNSPAATPPSLTPPALTPPSLTPPALTPPAATLPESSPPATSNPATLPPAGDPLARSGDLPGRTETEPGLTLPAPPTGTLPDGTLPDSTLPESAGDALPSAGSPEPGASGLSPSLGTGRPSLGIKVVPLNDTTRLQYSVRSPARQGAVIVDVRPGGPADAVGLPLGGVIVSVDGALVKDDQDLVEAISIARPGQEVELRYYQEERLATKSVRLGSLAAVGTAPAPAVAAPPARAGLYPGGGADGPMARRFEELVDPALRDNPEAPLGSTIMDPRRVAEMYEELKALKDKVQALEDKVRQLEGGRGAP